MDSSEINLFHGRGGSGKGLRVHTYSREDYALRLHDLRDALRSGLYPIVGVDLRAYGQSGQHAQVLVSLTSRDVRINDPLMGKGNNRAACL